MNWVKFTKIVIGSAILILGIYDIFAYMMADNASISVAITDSSRYSPWMPFAFGVLMGHWFFPAKGTSDP
jgi:hypothetical protein